MSEENVTDFLKRSKMEEILYDLSLDVINIKDKRLSEEDVEKLCERGFAFKLDADHLIGKSYLRSYIFGLLKTKEHLDIYLKIKQHHISPFLSSQILEDFASQKLAVKDKDIFIPDLDLMICEETIMKLYEYRIDMLSVDTIVQELGFLAEIKGRFDIPMRSKAYERCQEIVNCLITKGSLVRDARTKDTFYFNNR